LSAPGPPPVLGLVHVPCTHISPPSHFVLQSPQCFGSVVASTQAALHSESPASQDGTHCPFMQLDVPPAGGAHLALHAPQFATSLETSMHAAPHCVNPVAQANPHFPFAHVGAAFGGAEQTLAHAPQFAVSVFGFTHELLQFVVPAAQTSVHVPAEHVCEASHAVVQLPQWAAVVLRSTQVPLQLV
jgi:hypothetical protein